MARSLAQPSLLDRPVKEVMEAPFPVVDAACPAEQVAPMLSRDTPAVLVERNGELIGIVSRFDLLQQLIGAQ